MIFEKFGVLPSSERNIYGPKWGTSLDALARHWKKSQKVYFFMEKVVFLT